ncbi:beta-glucosidase [Nocardioides sp. Root1257]|uniref:GH1 family beta-glucosidase n=1 Tax=unclassified Nocardioides TaxID=2615069 RepID=UPI0006F9AD01|nr:MULTISPECIES: GH1 family beta-glucosidase [unclassified Nocardioides]KQW48717.1 beta-glucosidase [Nocardioides sp. Root1257]KRC47892.1 beta-glucosidase [Nocardioides sp. Root224]
MTLHLPDGSTLAFGAATAAYQIEGASTEDGRGASIWDTFAARPGATRDGRDGSVACDSYHRYEEDLDLVAGMNAGWYRFSVAWPRIVPTGTGAVETRGLDYYDRLVDAALARGVQPTATLYHWDLPQALEDRGGWQERSTTEAFADYAMVVHDRLGDRVKVWATHNEPWCAAYLGYAAGIHAPGRKEGAAGHRAAHHLNLAHGLAAARLHEAGVRDVGIVHNLAPFWPETPEAAQAADELDAVRNRIWTGPLVDGAYDEVLLRVAPVLADETLVRDGDLALVQGSADWLGVNYYTPFRPTLADPGLEVHPEVEAYPGVTPVSFVVREPRTDIGWEVDGYGLEELLVDTHKRTGLPIVVTENGAAYPDPVVDGFVDDQDRIGYLRDHIAATEAARAAGADVRGYIVWTLLDNFEWAEGYTKTFGVVHIDPEDLTRTPKASYHWLSEHFGPASS